MPRTAAPADDAERPLYRARAGTYLDRLYAEGDEVVWDGPPNRALEPVNDAAHAAVKANAARQRASGAIPAGATAESPAVAALVKRAEDAEFAVAERDEEITALKAEIATLKDEAAAKAGGEKK